MTAEHLGGTGGLPKYSVPPGSLRTVQRHLRPAKPNRMSFWGNGYVGRKLNMKTFINMLRDQSGASAAEYALILAIIGGAIALAALALGNAVANSMNRASNCIKTPSSTSC